MTESNNGESVSEPPPHKPKRHNAKLCAFPIRQRIVNALANGDSIRSISRALSVSNNTVVAIREQEWQQVAARKERIAAQAELNATLAAERMTDKLQSSDDIPLNTLVPTFGVAVDKMLALRGDSSLRIRHEHTHGLDDATLYAFMKARSQADELPPTVEAQIVPETRLLAEKTKRKKKANGGGERIKTRQCK